MKLFKQILVGVMVLLIIPAMSFGQGSGVGGTTYTTYKQRATPSNPTSGSNRIYFKSDNKLYSLTSGGVEAEIGAGGSGDVTSVGDCSSGACLDGTSDGGTYISIYGGALTKKTSLYAGNSASDLTFYLPTTAGATGGQLYFSSANNLAIAAAGTQYQIWAMGATIPSWTSTLSLSAIDMTSSTSSIPFPVTASSAAQTAAGSMHFESDTLILSIGDGATRIGLDFTANTMLTFPTATATISAAGDQFYIGTTQMANNRASNAQTIAGLTLTTPVIGVATGTSLALTGNLTGFMPGHVLTIASGTNDTAGDSTTTMHLDAQNFTADYVGMVITNITQTATCTITSTTAHELICSGALSGSKHWDNSDVWQVSPGPDQSGSVFYIGTASTILHPTTANYGVCYMVEGHVLLKIDFASTMGFTGTVVGIETVGDGLYIASSDTTVDDFVCIHNKSATIAKGWGGRGAWTHE
jgi:hypothetical protein